MIRRSALASERLHHPLRVHVVGDGAVPHRRRSVGVAGGPLGDGDRHAALDQPRDRGVPERVDADAIEDGLPGVDSTAA